MPYRLSRRRPHRTAARAATLILAAVTGLAGCGGTHAGTFQDSGGGANCQVHQTRTPSKAYTGGADGDTLAILTMMHYPVAHQAQPYCDGRPPSAIDKTWSALYTRLTSP